ncbi:MAG: MFS transporter [Actinomycetota bacterium]|nr:MFS transporter [Actinomycetota bacterium]MDH5312710.1 MFS transporter [Actinomycetota bacterium]
MTWGGRSQRAGTAVLALLATTQFLMTVDSTVMNVSISALVEDLDTTVSAIQGVITAYTLVMAAAMITGAKIGDILGRRRALRVGLIVYACGSAVTAISPNVGVLLFGWSLLEGLGAAMIMPTVVALVAGNFEGRRRAVAYGVLAAAAAVAVAAGPIIGGFVTAYFSWRWVFAAEVLIAAGILLGSKVVQDAPAEHRPRLDMVGALLSAAGLGMLVFGVLQSGTWGWIEPRVADGTDATPQLAGISMVIWLVLGGLLILWVFLEWLRRRVAAGREPLVDPSLFGNHQLTHGLVVLLMQYLVMMGMFFSMPLFLSLVLGLDAFETGIRMLPLSLALIVTAPSVAKLLPHAGPRGVVQVGLGLMLGATILLAARLDQGAGAEITTVPFILMGIGMGALASQLGNVVVSAVPVARGGEAGGLQYTAQNLGSSLGTALVGAVVIASLSSLFLQDVQSSDVLGPALKDQAAVEVGSGVEFVSTAQVEEALATTDLTPAEQAEILDGYERSQLGALSAGMVVLSLFVVLTLFFARRLPADPLIAEQEAVGSAGEGPA